MIDAGHPDWMWIENAAVLGLMVFFAWRASKMPSARTRRKIEIALQAKGMTLLDVHSQWTWRLGRTSRVILVARVKDVFGNDRNQYFAVDAFADILGLNARVREVSSPKSPMRAFDPEVF